MHRYLIVGKRFPNLTAYILDHGDEYVLLADKMVNAQADESGRNVAADFSSEQALLATVDSLEGKFDGVVATYENYILPAAQIANHLGLPGLPLAAAEACTDKELMRTLFAKAPEQISPAFAVAGSREEIIAFAQAHQFPLILKPANLAKSLLVTKNRDMDELLANYDKSVELLAGTYKKYAPNRKPKLIIEEFLEGSIHSVDAFIDSEGAPQILEQIVDYQTGYDIGYDDNFHYSRLLPSKLSADVQAAFRRTAELGVRALGIKNSPAHIEIIVTPAGPRIVEIGARNGGYRERMHYLSNGIDITGAALALARGVKQTVQASKNEPCAVLELFPKTPGIFTGLSNEQALRDLPSLNYISIKADPGKFIGKSSDGYKMAAVLILHNSDPEQFARDLEFVNSQVSVETNPSK